MLWPITPRLRDAPAMFHVEPIEDETLVWALPMLPANAAVAAWPAWMGLEHSTLCALLDGKMQREQDFLELLFGRQIEDGDRSCVDPMHCGQVPAAANLARCLPEQHELLSGRAGRPRHHTIWARHQSDAAHRDR